MKVLVTGAAGFIGFYVCKRLLDEGHEVVGIDNINNYYDVNLKYARLNELGIHKAKAEKYAQAVESTHYAFSFFKINLEDKEELPRLFKAYSFDVVCNLAAQAGVRYSIENPQVYIDSNIVGFSNLLECMRKTKVNKLVYASSSSIYGMNKKVPFSTEDQVDHPISLYAATKKSNELMAHTYTHLYGMQTIGLRFFTVYGPWGRPDMAMFLFTDAILNNKPIKVFNKGNLSRDFTYIDDIVEGIYATLLKPQNKQYALYNIGNGNPVRLMDFIQAIEKITGKEAIKQMMPMQPGDVEQTWADTTGLEKDYTYKPSTSIKEGIKHFVEWYKEFYN